MKRIISQGGKLFVIFGLLMPICFLSASVVAVPFSSQAPQGNWSQPWHDACEEVSIVMVDAYYNQKNLTAEKAKTEILRILEYKNKTLGESLDENVDTILFLIKQTQNWSARKVSYPSINLIKQELDNNRPVILPVAGDLLKNHHYQGSVPYHVLVITGYDEQKKEFIVNDPGTKYGENYRYSYELLHNAMHDFVARDPVSMLSGEKLAIFTFWPEKIHLVDKDLIKTANDSKVYYLEKNKKRHIINPKVFVANGWQWSDIKIIDEVQFNDFELGIPVDQVLTVYFPKLKNNILIKSNENVKVYWYSNNKKHYVVSPQVFIDNGWQWSKIIIVEQKIIDFLPDGESIK